MFCGIGPFAIRAAKQDAFIYANDLNPACYEYLQRNVKRNKVEESVKMFNLDAREIVRSVIANSLPKDSNKKPPYI